MKKNKNSGNSWSFRRQLVYCEDGGTIALDWWEEQRPRPRKQRAKASPSPPSSSPSSSSPPPPPPPPSPALPPTAPLLLVLHGLTGGSNEGYVRSLCAHAASRCGFRAAAVVYRGCGGLALTSPRAYSATFTADVSRAAAQARREFPLASAVVAVGFSLGAIILSKYLGEQDAGYWHHGRGGTGGGGRGGEWSRGGGDAESGGGDGGGKEKEEDEKKKTRRHFRHSPHQTHGGGEEDDDLIDAAVAVSSPFCLESAGEKLSRPWTGERRKERDNLFLLFRWVFFFSRPEKNSLSSLSLSLFSVFLKQKTVGWIYNAGLAIRLKHYMWSHRAQIFSSRGGGGEQQQQGRRKVQENPGGGGEREENAAAAEEKAAAASDTTIDRRALATSYLVHHIDDAASARANGYADRRAYYADAATRKAIPHVTRTPLLFVSSADDPFLGELPLEEIEKNPRTALVVTERGGHCAFVDEGGLGESAWVDRLALEWLVRAVARRKGERGRTGVLSKL